MSDTSTPPAGWYNDPSDPVLQRFWDGAAWTTDVAPVASSAPLSPAPAGFVVNQQKATRRPLHPGLVVGIVASAVVLLGGVVFAVMVMPSLNSQRAHQADIAAKAADDAARSDVSALAVEVAHYHWSSNGFQPEIAVVDGFYAFTDGASMTRSPTASPDVEIGGVTGTGYYDWCVWVTAPSGVVKDFEYSLQGRLAPGRCDT
ncbi:MAG: hypothetical protein CVT64_11570 [Actinobacteria bacterium HGW-Actinobacteria-4]|nr:MAG: hypothetical protein CVT64_11570 [Actinobacteria bacterium HGW-Actinobacteria-4]